MPGRVQVADHGLELAAPRPAGTAAERNRGVGGEKSERVVAPVVLQAAVDQVPVVDVLVHRQSSTAVIAQVTQIIQGRLGAQPSVGAAELLGHFGMQLGETLDVQLVDDRLVPGRSRPAVVAPGERRVDHRGERGDRPRCRARRTTGRLCGSPSL